MALPQIPLVQILDAFEAQLNLITEANGYDVTISEPIRSAAKPLLQYERPALNYFITNDRAAREDEARGAYQEDSRAATWFLSIIDKTRDTNHNDHAVTLATNVQTALYRDIAAPRPEDKVAKSVAGLCYALVDETAMSVDFGAQPHDDPYVEVQITGRFIFRLEHGRPYALILL